METELPNRQDPNHRQNSIPAANRWRTIAVLAHIAMEVSWISLWFNLLINPENRVTDQRAFIVLGAVALSVYFVIAQMNAIGLNLTVSRIVLSFLLLICTIAGLVTLQKTNGMASPAEILRRLIVSLKVSNFIPDALLSIFATLFVCWRAVSLAGRQLGPGLAVGGFRTGIVMFLTYGLLQLNRKIEPGGAFYVFLFSGLLAMSLSRIASIGHFRGGQQIRYNWRWFLGILFLILMMTGLAMLVGNFSNERRLDFIIWVFSWLGYGFVLLISPLLWFFVQGVYWVFEHLNLGKIIDALVSAYQVIISFFESALAVIRKWITHFQDNPILEIFSLIERSRPFLLLGGILIVILILVLAMKRYRSPQFELRDEDYQTLLDQQDLLNMIKAALRKGLDRIMEGLEDVFQLQTVRRLLAAARIRRIYARLMNLSARLDHPRPSSHTPNEFLGTLEKLFPAFISELKLITYVYIKVRYGELPEPSEEMEAVEKAWKRIWIAGNEMIKAGRKQA